MVKADLMEGDRLPYPRQSAFTVSCDRILKTQKGLKMFLAEASDQEKADPSPESNLCAN
jgi:hypothetical protein